MRVHARTHTHTHSLSHSHISPICGKYFLYYGQQQSQDISICSFGHSLNSFTLPFIKLLMRTKTVASLTPHAATATSPAKSTSTHHVQLHNTCASQVNTKLKITIHMSVVTRVKVYLIFKRPQCINTFVSSGSCIRDRKNENSVKIKAYWIHIAEVASEQNGICFI